MKTTKWLAWAGFVLIVLVFAVYAARFIERTSFEIDGTRYYALFDDAMISMRYAKNLAHGYGPSKPFSSFHLGKVLLTR